jgi:hypothetical protein
MTTDPCGGRLKIDWCSSFGHEGKIKRNFTGCAPYTIFGLSEVKYNKEREECFELNSF